MLDEKVLVRDYKIPNKSLWIKGRITEKENVHTLTWFLEITKLQKIWERHANQL